MGVELLNVDCITYMATLPDNAFDLAICDPPYGIGKDWKKRNKTSANRFTETSYDNKQIPTREYFNELKRVSTNQVIWGYNYYTEFLGSTNYLICWDKCSSSNGVFKYSQFELAYTTKHAPASIVKVPWDGYRMGRETGVKKIHPHQKPIDLYSWIFKNYACPGDKILDTHLGSGSSAIAAHIFGFDFVGCEIDEHNYGAAVKRFNKATAQISMF